MAKRQSGVVVTGSMYAGGAERYGVRVRSRVLGCLWWGQWHAVYVGNAPALLTSDEAHDLAETALRNGWVLAGGYRAEPLIGKDEE